MRLILTFGLFFLGACGLDIDEQQEEVGSVQQALAANCTLQRPYGWWKNGVGCMESRSLTQSTVIPHGGCYHAIGVPWGVMGEGSIDVCCDDGDLSEKNNICRRSSGNPP